MYLGAYPDKGTKDVVDGSDGGKRHIEDRKLTLQSVWNVILASSWDIHGSKVPAAAQKPVTPQWYGGGAQHVCVHACRKAEDADKLRTAW